MDPMKIANFPLKGPGCIEAQRDENLEKIAFHWRKYQKMEGLTEIALHKTT